MLAQNPSRALWWRKEREKELISRNEIEWKGLGAGKGYWVPLMGWPWAHEKARPKSLIKLKNGAYNRPNNKNFRPRKLRLTRKDADMTSSCPPLNPM